MSSAAVVIGALRVKEPSDQGPWCVSDLQHIFHISMVRKISLRIAVIDSFVSVFLVSIICISLWL